jgi:predicted transcriptional regulator
MDSPPPLEGFEAQVMEEIWRQGSVTVRDVMTAMNAAEPVDRAYTTYMTVLLRLHNKGLLARHREGKTNHYTPAVSREQYAASRVEADVQAIVERHGELALSAFARRVADLDPERREALERLAREPGDRPGTVRP